MINPDYRKDIRSSAYSSVFKLAVEKYGLKREEVISFLEGIILEKTKGFDNK